MIEGEYLLKAVRNKLRSDLKDVVGRRGMSSKSHNKSIQIMPDEKVPALAGEEFISVYGSQFVNLYPAQTQVAKESYSLSVGITRRVSGQFSARVGDTIYTKDTQVLNRLKPSMLKRARLIINMIDGIYPIINAANLNTDASLGECDFYTPLGLLSADAQPRYVDEDHFFTDPSNNKFHKGLFMEINFGGAELLRAK